MEFVMRLLTPFLIGLITASLVTRFIFRYYFSWDDYIYTVLFMVIAIFVSVVIGMGFGNTIYSKYRKIEYKLDNLFN